MSVDIPVVARYELHAELPESSIELTELITAQEEYFGARTTTSPALVATLLEEEGMQFIQVREPGSALLVAGAMYENPPPHVASHTRVWVHPDHMGSGIGSALTAWSIATARADIQHAPVGTRWRESELWDNELVWLVESEGQAVAMMSALDSYGTSTDTGYIAVLGVRKEWRGRGLAQALLTTAFDEFRRRGKSFVVLHVDADSLTGATRLYEQVGMKTTDRDASYEIEIRLGEDPLVR